MKLMQVDGIINIVYIDIEFKTEVQFEMKASMDQLFKACFMSMNNLYQGIRRAYINRVTWINILLKDFSFSCVKQLPVSNAAL